jgi:hypothetical protein
MNTNTRHLLIGLAALSVLVLSGCQTAATPPPADTPTEQPSFTLSKSPTRTDTPTEALTATETPTITPTFTETLAYNIPGTYVVEKCAYFNPVPDIEYVTISFCVHTVVVNDDSTMKFNVLWHYACKNPWNNTAGCPALIKLASSTNKTKYLTDDLENEYYYSAAGGAAAHEDQLDPNATIAGWFLFPPAKRGATAFQFIDLNNNFAIDNIILLPKTGTDTPTFTPTPPTGTPFNEPGTYYFYRCVTYPPSGGLVGAEKVKLCLNTVVVNDDRTMKFNLTWTVFTSIIVAKESDANNNNIFLLDNLDHEYKHIQTGGCPADIRGFARDGESCTGWFLFPAAQPGATSFRFVDLGNLISFDDLVLLPK